MPRKLLIGSLVLLLGVPALASDPDYFLVFDMPESQVQVQWGRLPWHGYAGTQADLLSAASFKGDSLRLLAILVEWGDRPGTLPWQAFDTLLFSRDVLPEGSLADYIHEVSYGQVKLTGDVFDWYNAGPTFGKYFPFSSLFEILDPYIDYSLYDGNEDRKADAICFIRSGVGEEDSQDPLDIWSYAAASDQGWGRYDRVQVDAWNTCPELKPLRDPIYPVQFSGETVRSGIRVFVHEVGHNIGLADLYDYDGKLVTSTYNIANDQNDHPLVDWDPMGYYGYGYLSLGGVSANHYCGWNKVRLGYIEPIILEGEYHDLVIYNVETTADSSLYRIPINDSDLEYFLLEYRNPQSAGKFDKFDSDFCSWFYPNLTFGYDVLDRGLLITHIDDSLVDPQEIISLNQGTPLDPHYAVCVEDAGYNPLKDYTYNPEGRLTDSAQWWYPWETRKGALFSSDVPGQSEFGPQTYPSSDSYYGYSGIYVRVDSIVGERMYLYVNTELEWLECCELRGDADHNGQFDLLDLDFIVDYLFRDGSAPICEQEADADDNDQVDILDVDYLIDYLHRGGPAPIDCPLGGIAPMFTSTPVTTATYGVLYSYDANADGDPDPDFSLTLAPPGMTIDPVTGLVEWTPDDVGDFDVTINASNTWGDDYQPYTISVSGIAPSFTTSPPLTGVSGELYVYDADADGYPVPSYSLVTFPAGMTVDPITGLIQWTPPSDGDYDVVLEATNSAGTTPQNFTISVLPAEAPVITSTPILTGTYNQLYTYDVEASGNPAPTFALTTYPTGMTIDPATGLIQWTPGDVGDYDVVVEASNSSGTDPQSFTISVAGIAPTFTSTPITTGTYQQLYSYDADADGYPAATFSLTTFPTGMTIDPASGLIQWTPDDDGDHNVIVEAANAYGTDIQNFTISVAGIAPTFISSPPTTGVVGVLYSYDAETDGYPAATFALTEFPTGMTIDPATGVVQWTPTEEGDVDVTIEASNAYGLDIQNYTISVSGTPEPPVITSTPVTSVTVGQAYAYDVEATGYPAPTFDLITSPSGMNINSTTGLISWTPGSVGDFDVEVEALNVNGADTQSFVVTVSGVAPSFTSTPILTATYGVQYEYDADATGDPTPTYALLDGPAGMTINSGTGVVRWTPADTGDVDVVIEAINAAGSTQQSYTIGVTGVAPAFTSTPVTTATYGQLYSYDANASGYPAATFALTTYPTGMTIDGNTGVIEWTPDATGDADVVVEATNIYGTDYQSFTISVSGVAPSFTSTPVTTGVTGVLYSYDADADGYPTPTYSLTTYPTGMTINSGTGLVEWTPDSEGDYDVEIEATNTYGTAYQNFTISVSAAPAGAVITSTPVTTATIDQPYTYDVEATGNPAPTFDLITSPSAMKINATTGVITWTPGSIGDYDVEVEAANVNGADTQSFILTVVGIPPTFTSTPITTGTYNVLYEYNADATGEPTPTYSLTTYPAGMTINSGTGLVRWTPSDTGNVDVVIEATNSAGTTPQSFTISVTGVAPAFTSTPVTTGTYGQLYSYDAEAGGYPAATYSLTTYPTGMTIDANTGVVEWTPSDIGDYNVVVEATNIYGTDTQPFTISVSGVAPFLADIPDQVQLLSVGFTEDADATGYPAPTYSLTTYPTGMTIDPITGEIAWTPTGVGDFDVVVEATNAYGTDTDDFVLTIVEVPTITSTAVTTGTYGQLYSYDVEADGYPAPTYALTTKPSGMTVDANTGVIEWTPADVGDYDVTVVAINSYGSDTQSFAITVVGIAPSFTSTPITTGSVGVLYTYDADASGYPAPTYALTTYPSGMTIDPVTGEVEFTPGSSGDYDVVIEATNDYGTDYQSYTINVP
ncbi:MAG: putative Ig domain-containing protein [Candidatus Zixiibacteriota bacterium]|nr:MAG: putative Ig domain-containing protein [candidate division Zixibacteria bacterium]